MNHDLDALTVSGHRPQHTPARRRLALAALTAGMLIASSCSLPFSEAGEDISTDVTVDGIEAGRSTSGNEARVDIADDEVVQGEEPTPPSTTELAATTAAPAPADPDAPIATAATVDTRFNGRSMQYLGIDLQLGDFITTNQSLEQYLGSLPPTDTDQFLLIEVAVTNPSSGTVTIPIDVFGIRLPSGEWIAPNEMREPDGDAISSARPATQATERVILEYPSIDLTGASFEISDASTIPESIPLDPDQEVPAPYLVELDGQALVAGLRSPSVWEGCDYAWSGEVIGGRITVEGVDGSRLERATKGQRWVAIELRAGNDTPESDEFYPCNSVGVSRTEISPRLQIDGVSTSSTNDIQFDRIETGTVATIEFWFQISVDTSEIELTDVDGTRIAVWNLDLPLVDGEL